MTSKGLLNIAVTYDIGSINFDRIKSAAPGSTVHDISGLITAERNGDPEAKAIIDRIIAGADVLYTRPHRIPPDLFDRMPRLRWIQMTSAGVDMLRETGIFKRRVTITNVRGMHAVSISEYVLQLMLMFVKGAPRCFEQKKMRKWSPFHPHSLESKTVGIVGLGSIGREIARLSKSFGIRVIATRRSVKTVTKARYVDQLLPAVELPALLKESDFVVIVVPYTPETDKLIGDKELRMMKKDAYFINVARGTVVDESALINALENGAIAGAGLDVFEKEPLPVDSKLWNMPNVIITPHLSGGMDNYYDKATAIFCDNIERFIAGRKLRNLVNRKKGY